MATARLIHGISMATARLIHGISMATARLIHGIRVATARVPAQLIPAESVMARSDTTAQLIHGISMAAHLIQESGRPQPSEGRSISAGCSSEGSTRFDPGRGRVGRASVDGPGYVSRTVSRP